MKTRRLFSTARQLSALIDSYFTYLEGEYHEEEKAGSKDQPKTKQRVYTREPEPPTFSGLALYLGFNSRQAFINYEASGKYSELISRAKLRIEAAYEKKLHYQSPTGAVFALKMLGWTEKTEEPQSLPLHDAIIRIEIIESGPQLAAAEQEVVM